MSQRMGENYLIDSNAIIDFCNGTLPINGKNLLFSISTPQISIISNIELFANKNISQEEFNLLEKFVHIATVYPLNTSLIAKTIEIRQEYRIKLPDAVIAATAVVNKLTLVSRNTSDFNKIQGLTVVDPWNV